VWSTDDGLKADPPFLSQERESRPSAVVDAGGLDHLPAQPLARFAVSEV